MIDMTDSLIETWRQIIVGGQKSWVLFENGTCVILMNPEADLRRQATELLKEWGPVQGAPCVRSRRRRTTRPHLMCDGEDSKVVAGVSRILLSLNGGNIHTMNERQQAHIDFYLKRLEYWRAHKPSQSTARLLAARDADEAHPLRSEEEATEVVEYLWRLEREQLTGRPT